MYYYYTTTTIPSFSQIYKVILYYLFLCKFSIVPKFCYLHFVAENLLLTYWYYKVLPEVFFTFITLLTGLSNLKKLLSNRLSMDGTELSKNGKAFEKIEDEDQKLIVSQI